MFLFPIDKDSWSKQQKGFPGPISEEDSWNDSIYIDGKLIIIFTK